MGNANSGHGSGPEHRDALLSLLEVHTEGASATELGSYTDRHRVAARKQLLRLQQQGKVTQTPDHLWHLTDQEATHRSTLTPAPSLPLPLKPSRIARRTR